MKKLGLVGGVSWVSTIDYYKLINEGINEKLGGLNFAECLIYSLNFNDVQKVGWNNSYQLLLDASLTLKKSGADAIVLCCNTGHIFADRLKKEVGLPLVHIVEATSIEIEAQNLKKIGLIGTIFTMEMDFFKKGLLERGIETIIPEKQETRNYIQQTVKEELGKGIINQETRQNYIEIINQLIHQGAEAIVLGCTEIPLIVSQQDFSVPVFDTTKIHSRAAVEFALN